LTRHTRLRENEEEERKERTRNFFRFGGCISRGRPDSALYGLGDSVDGARNIGKSKLFLIKIPWQQRKKQKKEDNPLISTEFFLFLFIFKKHLNFS